jgi:hypothetical protein
VSAFYHADLGFFGGTEWLYGPTVSGTNVTSKVSTEEQDYCTLGWRYEDSAGWHLKVLDGPGC